MVYHKTATGYQFKENIPASLKKIEIKEIAQIPEVMEEASFLMKEFLNLDYIHLPVHDIPVLHALGVESDISWEDGIMLHSEPYTEMTDLKKVGFNNTDLAPLFQVIHELKAKGEQVFIEIPGIYTALSSLVPFDKIVKSAKQPIYKEITNKAVQSLKDYVRQLDDLGVDMIYYSDELSRLDILGTRFYQQYYAEFAREILELSNSLNHAQLSIGKYTFEAMKSLQILEKDAEGKIESQGEVYSLTEKESVECER